MTTGAKLTFAFRLKRAIAEPERLRAAVLLRLNRIPFQLGIRRIWPGVDAIYTPDRFFVNFGQYREIDGIYSPGDTKKYFRGNYTNNCGDITRFYFLNLVADQLLKEGIQGDTAEMGVYKGNTAFLVAKLARRLGSTAYLFDTYEGFPVTDLDQIDAGEAVAFKDTSVAAVEALVGASNVTFVKGYFPDSAAQINGDQRYALVHIDCDLYAPCKAALEYFYPRLVAGGFLVIHDYSSLRWKGVEKAVDDFFKDKPEFIIPVPDKSGTVVIRKL